MTYAHMFTHVARAKIKGLTNAYTRGDKDMVLDTYCNFVYKQIENIKNICLSISPCLRVNSNRFCVPKMSVFGPLLKTTDPKFFTISLLSLTLNLEFITYRTHMR